MRRWAVSLVRERSEFFRALVLVAVMRPAAVLLPMKAVNSIALFFGIALAALSSEGRDFARNYRKSFGGGRIGALESAARWESNRFREFAWHRRVVRGKIQAGRLPIEQSGAEPIREVIRAGGTVIVAHSHFIRDDASFSLVDPRAVELPPTFIVAAPPSGQWSPSLWRKSLQYRELLKALSMFRRDGIKTAKVGKSMGVPLSLIRDLRARRTIGMIMVDSRWPAHLPGALVRDFAGERQQSFATGVGTIARLAQCHIVPCRFLHGPTGVIQIHWGAPIAPADPRDEDWDALITSRILDEVEREVGRRPQEYLFPLGGQRCWNAETESWVCAPSH